MTLRTTPQPGVPTNTTERVSLKKETIRAILFLLFFISGFSSLVYQVVWTRLAFASFGIITPVLSVILSIFMLGLSLGAWAAGIAIGVWVKRTRTSSLVLYAIAETIIGLGAFAVPVCFSFSEAILLRAGQTNSLGYLAFSAIALTISILPWCICMGATFPLMMGFVREWDRDFDGSFSFLYLANVLGAMSGTFMTAVVLVEAFGFRHTLGIAACGNFSIAAVSALLAWRQRERSVADLSFPDSASSPIRCASRQKVLLLLFTTGFSSMALEVVWSRSFAPVLKTQVYSFAAVLFAYLGATFLGSFKYRRDFKRNAVCTPAVLIALLAIVSFLPIIVNDPRLLRMSQYDVMHLPSVAFLLFSICPLCAVLGYLTPQLVDDYGQGNPTGAGKAYAVNVLGCIIGPLVASYLLLPRISDRHAMVLLSAPFLVLFVVLRNQLQRWVFRSAAFLSAAIVVCGLVVSMDFERSMLVKNPGGWTRRDYAASVVACGNNFDKQLLVNGIGMTKLTPVTKFMVDLPLAFMARKPSNALIICFGMGTSYRSALSWDLDTTAVELVPSVKQVFPFFCKGGEQLMKDGPKRRIIIDDGRRYLKRVDASFDLITVDPPPPIQAAGCSLLYSSEFLTLVKDHLKPGGILQLWYPGGEKVAGQAILRTVVDSFPHVRVFQSVEGWGAHIIASKEPLVIPTEMEIESRFPEPAKNDLLEWSTPESTGMHLLRVLKQEISIPASLNSNPNIRIVDDKPLNEYFLIRRSIPFAN